MNRRARPIKPHHFHKYLKPGALARIRDSQITARRINRLNSLCHLPLHPSPSPSLSLSLSNDAQPQINDASDGFPCFVGRIYGPRCPQRKKLMASKSVFFITASSPTNSTTDSPDTVLVDSFSNDIVIAN